MLETNIIVYRPTRCRRDIQDLSFQRSHCYNSDHLASRVEAESQARAERRDQIIQGGLPTTEQSVHLRGNMKCGFI